MEEWKLEFDWLRTRHLVKDNLGLPKLPDLNAILMLIGIQEYGRPRTDFTKEEKQDLMHVAVCELLSGLGYFEFEGRDSEGWPHYKKVLAVDIDGVEAQELVLKEQVIGYFQNLKET